MALKTLLAVVLVFNYTVGTLLVWNSFQAYPDHSSMALVRWAAIYIVAVIQPGLWSVYHLHVLRSRGLEIDRQLRAIAFSPVMVGAVTLLIALNLIEGR